MKKIIFIAFILALFVTGCSSEDKASPEKTATKNEIKVSGQGVDMIISPSNDNIIKDIITITVTKVPENTGIVAFGIQGGGIEPLEKTGPNLGMDSDSSDGWSFKLDTRAYSNKEYMIAAIAFKANRQSGDPPLGAAQTQVIIQNSAGESLAPPVVNFPKIISIGPSYGGDGGITEIKEMDANVVGLLVQSENRNGKFMLKEDSEIYLKRDVLEAYRNGLAVYLAVLMPPDIKKDLPYREGSDYDLPPGYDLVSLRGQLKTLYREVAILAEQNKVSGIVVFAEIEPMLERVYQDSEEYWTQSSKINLEVVNEIRKYYNGDVVGSIMGGMFGFDAPCCYTNVPVDKIDFTVFDALLMPTSSDYRIIGSSLGYVDEGLKRIEFTRELANKNKVKKIYVEVGGYPLISPWNGDRVVLYGEFIEKSLGKTDGYSVAWIPKEIISVYDDKAIDAVKIWYKKI